MPADHKDNSFKIKIDGDGIAISREVDAETARAIINALMGGSMGYTPAEPQDDSVEGRTHQGSGQRGGPPRQISLREFMDGAGAQRMPDKIVTIGEYIVAQEGQQEFSRDDVKSRFKQAGESPPGNFGRDFNWAITNGWIAEDAKKAGSYYVTTTGRDAIKAKFSPEVRKSTAQPGGRRRGRRKRGVDQSDGADE